MHGSSTCPHSTGCRRRPTSLASRRSSAGLHRRQRCRRRTQRMPRAPRRPAAPAPRSSTIRNTSSSGASAQVRDLRVACRFRASTRTAATSRCSCPLAEVLLAVAGAGNQLTGTGPDAASQVPYGTEITGFRRVAMHQVLATATKTFGPILSASQVVAIAEVGYTHLDLPGNLKFAGPGCHLPQPGSDASSAYNSTSVRLLRDPQFVGLPPRGPGRLRQRDRRRHGNPAHRVRARRQRRRSDVQCGGQGVDPRSGRDLFEELAGRSSRIPRTSAARPTRAPTCPTRLPALCRRARRQAMPAARIRCVTAISCR